MFLYNVGWAWDRFGKAAPHGVIFNPSGFDHPTAVRREFSENLPEFMLFDPQLYLCDLDADECAKTCARLISYPYLGTDIPEFDSDAGKRKSWLDNITENIEEYWPPKLPTAEEDIRRLLQQAIEFQMWFGVSRPIIPVPAIQDTEQDIEAAMQWVDIGHEEAAPIQKKYKSDAAPLVTIALSDHILHAAAPENNKFLQAIIDQVTARDECRGIYFAVIQEPEPSDQIISVNVASSILYATHIFAENRHLEVYLNFANLLGFTALGAGASGFGSGYEKKAQRCCLADFVERGGGPSYPRFHSFATACGYLTERDMLDKIAKARLTRLFRPDETPASKNLLEALLAPVANRRLPADWAETKNNVTAAHVHYIQLVTTAVDRLMKQDSHAARAEWVLEWLQEAERTSGYLEQRFSNDQLSDSGRHVRAWRQAFENYVDAFGVL